tara:strand:+ start:988 stop:1233 length:246 start_codon:yes stop_codon:yes gene_type:complete
VAVSDEIREIYILLKGDNSDRNDGGLCEDVKTNTKFRKSYYKRESDIDKNTEHRKSQVRAMWFAISSLIGLAIKVLYDAVN